MALTDHDSLSGSMEFAQAAKALGLRAIHGAEVTLDDGRHITLLVRDETGWRNLCRLLTKAHAHTRDGPQRDRSEPFVSLDAVEEHRDGLVCLSGCAARGVRDEPTMRRLLAAFGRDDLRVELQRPLARHDRALNRGLSGLAERLGVATVATGNVHAHSAERALLQDAFVAIREHSTLDASEPLRRGNHAHVLTHAAGDGRALLRSPARPSPRPSGSRSALTFDLCNDLGYRYPGAEDAGADRALAEICRARFDERYPRGSVHRAEAELRLEDELRVIDVARPGGLLRPASRDPRARARDRRAGPRARQRAGAAAARPRAWLERVVDRLPPHGPQPCRPDRQQAPARALPQRGADGAAGHRPRLPARHPRGADPAHPRGLRQRALGARGRLPDLPGARGDPRARQGARAGARGDRARRARQRGLVGRATSTATSTRRWARDGAPAAGRGSRGWPPRRRGCRAISPSTPAG